ncbi:MAG: hypothetical protein ABI880_13085 [Acidobacteriota bacterium]
MSGDTVGNPARMGPLVRTHWPALVAAAVLVGSVVMAERAVVALTSGRFIYALDDAYIHMAMARNLAEHGIWGCTPFRFSAASSSPLWTAVLAIVYRLTGARELTPLVLNVVFGVMTIAVADAVLRRLAAGALLRVATLVGLVLVVPMAAMALLGMEHVLHLLLTIAFGGAITLALAGAPEHTRAYQRHTATLSVLAALLATSRYEGLFLVALACLACVALGHWRRGVVIGGAAALPIVLFGVISVANGSLFLPNSLMLKAGGEAASMWTVLFRGIGAADVAFLQKDHPLLWLVLGGSAATLIELVRGRRWSRAAVLVPLLMTLMVVLHVHFALSSSFWVYRYDAYLLGFGVFAAAVVLAGVPSVPRRGPGWISRVATAAAVLVITVVIGDPREGLRPENAIQSAWLTYREHYQAARFVHDTRFGETVLINDAGAMAFYSGANLLDIFGLCDIEPVKLRRAGTYGAIDVEAWTLPYQPTAAVVQLSWGWVVGRIPADWLKVAEVEVQPDGQVLGFFVPTHDPNAADRLRADVERFYRPLASALHYRVRTF